MRARRSFGAVAILTAVRLLIGPVASAQDGTPGASDGEPFAGCRSVEAKTISELFGSQGEDVYTYRLEILWCAEDGRFTEAEVIETEYEIGDVPFWEFDEEEMEKHGGVDFEAWAIKATAKFAWSCVDLRVFGGCTRRSTAWIELTVDAELGYTSIDCRFPNCSIVRDEPFGS